MVIVIMWYACYSSIVAPTSLYWECTLIVNMGINGAKKMDIFYEYQWQKVLHQWKWTQKIINELQEKMNFLKDD